jgi:hypothetical protein
MPDFTWMAAEEDLSPAALTVRAQLVDPTDNGRLLWDGFMPRRNVDQTKLSSLSTSDVRITSDRREWNQRGRFIPLFTPPTKELEWIPIESYFRLEEKEINTLMNEVRGNQALFRQLIGARIPERTMSLVTANYRRLELDVFRAWANGNIVSMNPQTGATFTVSYNFDVSRYQTATTAWSDVSVNAYEELLAWYQDALQRSGPGAGVMLRLATRNAIVADAPNLADIGGNGIRPTVGQVEARIQDELGVPFRFFVNESTIDTFNDGGVARSTVNVWPTGKVAFVPAGFQVGTTAFAPVLRAYDISNQTPDAGVDIRGNTVYHEIGNGGRDLIVECQFNPMPDPDERRMDVIAVGV